MNDDMEEQEYVNSSEVDGKSQRVVPDVDIQREDGSVPRVPPPDTTSDTDGDGCLKDTLNSNADGAKINVKAPGGVTNKAMNPSSSTHSSLDYLLARMPLQPSLHAHIQTLDNGLLLRRSFSTSDLSPRLTDDYNTNIPFIENSSSSSSSKMGLSIDSLEAASPAKYARLEILPDTSTAGYQSFEDAVGINSAPPTTDHHRFIPPSPLAPPSSASPSNINSRRRASHHGPGAHPAHQHNQTNLSSYPHHHHQHQHNSHKPFTIPTEYPPLRHSAIHQLIQPKLISKLPMSSSHPPASASSSLQEAQTYSPFTPPHPSGVDWCKETDQDSYEDLEIVRTSIFNMLRDQDSSNPSLNDSNNRHKWVKPEASFDLRVNSSSSPVIMSPSQPTVLDEHPPHAFLTPSIISTPTPSPLRPRQSKQDLETSTERAPPPPPSPFLEEEMNEVLTWNGTQPSPISVSPQSPPLLESPTQLVEPPSEPTSPAVWRKENVEDGGYWSYFKSELVSTDFDEGHDVKKERVKNFLSVPNELEMLVSLGYVICFDSFLYIFTILPFRIVIAVGAMLRAMLFKGKHMMSAQKVDIMKGSLVIMCCMMLEYVDASRLYHSVRGQATIKLYVIFNVLEICDKLCSAFGHDILDSLFSKATVTPEQRLSTPTATARRRIGRVTHFLVALVYVYAHAMVLFYQVMTLNVAVNSYNNALLTLLLSNQFVEIKSSVFKRFERENLFQLSCSDIVERFQLSVFLGIITVRNYVEVTGGQSFHAALELLYDWLSVAATNLSSFSSFIISGIQQGTLHADLLVSVPQHLPNFQNLLALFNPSHLSTVWNSNTTSLLFTLFTPPFIVFGTEVLVDWLKHAFITKFNQIRPNVYSRFYDSLCRDLVRGKHSHTNSLEEDQKGVVDSSPVVARRIGFVSIPLACLMVRVSLQTIRMLTPDPVLPWELDFTPPLVIPSNTSASIQIPEWVGSKFNETSLVGQVGKHVVEVLNWFREPVIVEWSFDMASKLGLFFGRVLVGFIILLCIKLFVGLNLIRTARKRILLVSHSTEKNNVSSAPPVMPPPTPKLPNKWTEDELVARGKSVYVLQKDSKEVKQDTPPPPTISDDPRNPDEKLDRVDRFLMVKSRIV
ncbi:hypothetical protein HDV05_007151 [Chytridiales sp. JEL 0842]|nr:hypothetical protein HDV05_007151 [Chytridiales sp. JEL 0842]